MRPTSEGSHGLSIYPQVTRREGFEQGSGGSERSEWHLVRGDNQTCVAVPPMLDDQTAVLWQ